MIDKTPGAEAEAPPPAVTRRVGKQEFGFSERIFLGLERWINERPGPKRAQEIYLRSVAYTWMRAALANRFYVEGLDQLAGLDVDRGVLVVSNHRSFFDQYAMMLAIWMGRTPWAQQIYFPVRSNFFYERFLGLFTNLAVGAGVMYPPIFRDPTRAPYNRGAVQFLCERLQHRGVLVGVHPEGRRNKDADPYRLLPAQPGAGEIALKAKPIVVPVFINGLSNDLLGDIRSNFSAGIRRERPAICVIGKPIDYEDLQASPPRPALHKRLADRFCAEIAQLGERERVLRTQCLAGEMADDDAGWLINRPHRRFYVSR